MWLLVIGASGCMGHLSGLTQKEEVRTQVGAYDLRYAVEDGASERLVRHALESAAPKLERWGHLREPIVVWLLPSHEALEQTVNRPGYDWLRAWARYDEVFVQTPRSWSLFGASQSTVDELLLHELTHCVMYQLAADKQDWMKKEIPLWFREGMASVTAAQAYRWPGLEAVARYYAAHPERDPAERPEEIYKQDMDIVYGAAHHAFAFLSVRYGDDRIRELLTQMRAGQKFSEAFSQVIGLTPTAFLNEFERFLRLRGFKGKRLKSAP